MNVLSDVIADDGGCSLREAITAANTDTASGATSGECAAGSGADVISLPAGVHELALAGADENANATGDLDISTDVTLRGVGAGATVIDGNSLDRVIHTTAGTVVVEHLTVTGGGGGVCDGGGIYAQGGSLTVNDTTVAANIAGAGGGIESVLAATLTVNRTRVIGNTGVKRGGGFEIVGTATINDSVISGNVHSGANAADPPCVGTASFGGGGIFTTGSLTINDTTLASNSAAHRGGGIYSFLGTLTINRSTFEGNSASDQGGAIQNPATATIENTTISGNTATQGGGAIGNSGTMTITHSTIASNGSQNGTDGILDTGTFNIGGSILADGTQGGEDCAGSITSQGYNLIENATGCTVGGTTTGDLTGIDPMLVALADNGGPTETHRLPAASPAVDAGDPACPPPAVDQRGEVRESGAACDIGAYERDDEAPAPTIAFPTDGAAYRSAAFAAGCLDGTPDVCGAAADEIGGSGLDAVELRIQRASDGLFWDGADWGAEIWIDPTGRAAWSAPFAPAEGGYTLTTRAADLEGNQGDAEADFIVDDTAPTDPALSSASHSVGVASSDPTVDVTWAGESDALSGVDGFSILWDTSPGTVPDAVADVDGSTHAATSPALADGAGHWFHLRTVDAAGNWTSTEHLGPFSIDTAPPDTTITAGPSGTVFAPEASLTFSSSEPGSFQCALDDATFAACTSPASLTGLADGVHIFRVRAADAAGNVDPSPADRVWAVASASEKLVLLEAKPRRPAAGGRSRLTGEVVPCAGHEGDLLRFERKRAGGWKALKTVATNDDCRATILVRIRGLTNLRAISRQQDDDHLEGRSDRVRIRPRT